MQFFHILPTLHTPAPVPLLRLQIRDSTLASKFEVSRRIVRISMRAVTLAALLHSFMQLTPHAIGNSTV